MDFSFVFSWSDNQQSVLEYLAVQDVSTGSLALPGVSLTFEIWKEALDFPFLSSFFKSMVCYCKKTKTSFVAIQNLRVQHSPNKTYQ